MTADGRATVFTTDVRLEVPTTSSGSSRSSLAGGGVASVTTYTCVVLRRCAELLSSPGLIYRDLAGTATLENTTTSMALTLGGGASFLVTDIRASTPTCGCLPHGQQTVAQHRPVRRRRQLPLLSDARSPQVSLPARAARGETATRPATILTSSRSSSSRSAAPDAGDRVDLLVQHVRARPAIVASDAQHGAEVRVIARCPRVHTGRVAGIRHGIAPDIPAPAAHRRSWCATCRNRQRSPRPPVRTSSRRSTTAGRRCDVDVDRCSMRRAGERNQRIPVARSAAPVATSIAARKRLPLPATRAGAAASPTATSAARARRRSRRSSARTRRRRRCRAPTRRESGAGRAGLLESSGRPAAAARRSVRQHGAAVR